MFGFNDCNDIVPDMVSQVFSTRVLLYQHFLIVRLILDNFGVSVITAAESYNDSTKNLGLAIAAYDQAVMTQVADVVLRIAGRT
jgi:hypothetical protein